MTPKSEAIKAEVILSSQCMVTGKRLDTLKVRYPRMVHADFLTHRRFSRNGSSSRAMPSVTLLRDDPYVPTFRKNKPGMAPGEHLSFSEQLEAERLWMEAAIKCAEVAAELSAKDGLNVHKQWTNRMLEWFGYITVVVSATDFTNYLALRDEGGAQDEIQWQAQAVRDALLAAKPQWRKNGEWHLPFITEEDRYLANIYEYDTPDAEVFRQIDFAFVGELRFLTLAQKLLLAQSTARCARTSYRNFDGSMLTVEKDVATFMKLGSQPIHASPMEHQGRPAILESAFCGNFDGWEQFRKFVPGEATQTQK